MRQPGEFEGDSGIAPLDPELAALFEGALFDPPAPPAGVKDRVRNRLRVVIATSVVVAGTDWLPAAAARTATRAVTLAKSWWLIGAVAIGVGTLGAFTLGGRTTTPLLPRPAAPPSQLQGAAGPAPGTGPSSSLREERELLVRAQRALGKNDLAMAEVALAEHRRRFPTGALQEEREALQIVAATKRGDVAAARAGVARFHQQFPNSIQRRTVDQSADRVR